MQYLVLICTKAPVGEQPSCYVTQHMRCRRGSSTQEGSALLSQRKPTQRRDEGVGRGLQVHRNDKQREGRVAEAELQKYRRGTMRNGSRNGGICS